MRQLAERADPDAAPTLITLLDTTNDARSVPVVTAALAGLRQLGASVVPLVLAAFDEPPSTRRPFMPLLLASALGAAAAPRLIEALHDAQPEVRINAATQLGALRDTQAFEPLLALLEDEHEDGMVRGVAAAALGALRDPRSLPILAALSEQTTQTCWRAPLMAWPMRAIRAASPILKRSWLDRNRPAH